MKLLYSYQHRSPSRLKDTSTTSRLSSTNWHRYLPDSGPSSLPFRIAKQTRELNAICGLVQPREGLEAK